VNNGATTTLDTLWMGVPMIALCGERGISRSSYSIMQSLAARELIARDVDEYVHLNVRLAQDVTRRKALRSTLRRRLERSPLMDAAPSFAISKPATGRCGAIGAGVLVGLDQLTDRQEGNAPWYRCARPGLRLDPLRGMTIKPAAPHRSRR